MLMLQLPAVHLKSMPLRFHLGADDGINILDQIHHILIRQIQCRLARFDLADIQNVIDQPQQMLAG